MTDQEINEKLDEVLKRKYYGQFDDALPDYKDPAIFAENVKYMIYHCRGGIGTPNWMSFTSPCVFGEVYREGKHRKSIMIKIEDGEVEKAVALARIAAHD